VDKIAAADPGSLDILKASDTKTLGNAIGAAGHLRQRPRSSSEKTKKKNPPPPSSADRVASRARPREAKRQN
jgi:hypothetical protein